MQCYDHLSIPANSDEEEVKSFIEDRLTKPPVPTAVDFLENYYDVLFTQSEKDAIQRKKEQLLQEYLAEQERKRIEKEQAEEQARIAREEQRRKNELKGAEYKALLEEVRPLGFTKSSQVSNYIREHDLKQKYGSISGYLEMNRLFDNWI